MREELESALEHATLAADLAARSGAVALQAQSLGEKGAIETLLGRSTVAATLRAAGELGAEPDRVVRFAKPCLGGVPVLDRRVRGRGCAAAPALRGRPGERGDESSVSMILANLAAAEYLAGRWQEAARVAEEGYEVALQTAQRPQQAWALSIQALVRASLGREVEARADAEEALTLAGERGMGVARIHAVWALGLLELSLGRPEETARLLAPERERLLAAGVGEPGTIRFVPDEIEALVALGRLDEAEAVPRLARGARPCARSRFGARGRPAAAAGCSPQRQTTAKARSGSSSKPSAEHDARHPCRSTARARYWPSEERSGARSASGTRGQTLDEALAVFEELGAALWAEKARAELGRISGRAASHGETHADRATRRRPSRQGQTNKEVAAELFVPTARSSTTSRTSTRSSGCARAPSWRVASPDSPAKP